MSDSEYDSDAPVPTLPTKKRQLSEKQKAGLAKGLEVLRAKREALKKEKEARKAFLKSGGVPPNPSESPAAPPASAPAPAPAYVSASEFGKFKEEIMSALKPTTPAPIPAPALPSTRVITGSELLDRIFFNK